MSKVIWFKAKPYGYGWYPATWQGWLSNFVWAAILALNAWRLMSAHPVPAQNTIEFVIETLLATAILVFVAYKTGEELRWRWGGK